ncbi:hypothetical protein MPSEU_001042900 [Mayamaea pseudoterrestris]|nr:hypothetical protein MPSEU_001042900 [Mayamaea pseudoterrestris]
MFVTQPLWSSHGMDGKMSNMTTASHLKSSTTHIITAVRVAVLLVCLIETDVSTVIQNPVLSSVLVDPVFTVKHVREALAIQSLTGHPYSTITFRDAYAIPGTIHLPPLLLAVCELVFVQVDAENKIGQLKRGLLLIIIDLLVARSLELIAKSAICRLDAANNWEESLQQKIPHILQAPLLHVFGLHTETKSDSSQPLLHLSDLPRFVSQLYYASPIVMLATAKGSFQNLETLFIVQALAQSALSTGSVVSSAMWLALATYMNIHCVIMLIPIAIWMHRRSKQDATLTIILSFLFSAALQLLTLLLIGSERYYNVMVATQFHSFSFVGMQPSLSTLWYLSMELFGRFRNYFTILLGGVPYITIIPLTVRLHKYPFALAAIFYSFGTLFRPPGTLYSLNVAICLAFLSPRSMAHMPKVRSIILVCAIPVPIILYMVCYWLWMDTQVGEANFVYFQCIAYNVFVGLLFVEFCSASLQRDKVLRVTEKL